jgi:tetratricopeptide (TPR) repeat protein
MPTSAVAWVELSELAQKLSSTGHVTSEATDADWFPLEEAFGILRAKDDYTGLMRLRNMFSALYAQDTFGGNTLLQQIDSAAIHAARQLKDEKNLAHFLGAKGHNLHRQGYHAQAVTSLTEASLLYERIGDSWEGMKNHYMTALCFRALGKRGAALQVLDKIFASVEPNDPWYGQPLQVKAWLVQDAGDLVEAEQLLRQAVQLHLRGGVAPLVSGAMADLGEVVGLQGRFVEALGIFHQGLAMLHASAGQYQRLIARTKLKLAELQWRNQNDDECLDLLNEADLLISGYGHYYDLMWRIELLRALIYLRRREWYEFLQKGRLTLRIRRDLNLSNVLLIQQMASRAWLGIGLPR